MLLALGGNLVLDGCQATIHLHLLGLEGSRCDKGCTTGQECTTGVRDFFLSRCIALAWSAGGRLVGIAYGALPALFHTIHTCHTSAIVNSVTGKVYARCLAILGTKSAIYALARIYHRAKP